MQFPEEPEPSYTSASSESTQNTRVVELQDRNRELQSELNAAERGAERVAGNLEVRDGQLEMATALIATLRDRLQENEAALAAAKQLLLQREGSEANKDRLLLIAKEEAAKSRQGQAKSGAVIMSLIQVIVVMAWITLAAVVAYLLK